MPQINPNIAGKSSSFSKGVTFGQSPCSASFFTIFPPKLISIQFISAVAFELK